MYSWCGDQNVFVFVDMEEWVCEWVEMIVFDVYGIQCLFDFENLFEGFMLVYDCLYYVYIVVFEDVFFFDDDVYLFRFVYGVIESDLDIIVLELILFDGVEVSCEFVVVFFWWEVIGLFFELVFDWIEVFELMCGELGMGFCGIVYGYFWSGVDWYFYGMFSNIFYCFNLLNDDYFVIG